MIPISSVSLCVSCCLKMLSKSFQTVLEVRLALRRAYSLSASRPVKGFISRPATRLFCPVAARSNNTSTSPKVDWSVLGFIRRLAPFGNISANWRCWREMVSSSACCIPKIGRPVAVFSSSRPNIREFSCNRWPNVGLIKAGLSQWKYPRSFVSRDRFLYRLPGFRRIDFRSMNRGHM